MRHQPMSRTALAAVTSAHDIAATKASARRLTTIYTQKLANLNEPKQSLLQKAFTGQLTAAKMQMEAAR